MLSNEEVTYVIPKHALSGVVGFMNNPTVIEENSYWMGRELADNNKQDLRKFVSYALLYRYKYNELQILTYRRGNKHRLAGLYSVGWGGHFEPIDQHDDVYKMAVRCVKREMYEELNGLDDKSIKASIHTHPLISDNEMSKDYIAFCFLMEIDADAKVSMKEDIDELIGWLSVDELLHLNVEGHLEDWSMTLLEELIDNIKNI